MGIKVGLGTDNVYHTMWETMRAAIYGARARERLGEPVSPSYYEVLELATIHGAEVLGIADSVGSLETGKKADIQLIDLYQSHIIPTADITSSLVLYGATTNVDTVIVNGNIVKKNGVVSTIDVADCLEKAQVVTQEIWDNLFHERPELRR
jgi:5-methylthioadenosine/S-adenosylhomocysteine deaminase